MKWHEHCKYMELERDYSLLELAKFHGHLGPYLILGYRMGKFALKYFGDNPFALFATVYCSGKTPESCLIDGVQLGCGCTFGKRNIDLHVSGFVEVMFQNNDGRAIILKPGSYQEKVGLFEGDDKELAIEQFSEVMYDMTDEELFVLEELS